jgi:hypothetical protein
MMRRKAVLVLAIAALGGLFGVTSSVPEAQAQSPTTQLTINPGATNALTCGWHDVCSGGGGTGCCLDWSNAVGAGVYFRSWGWRSGAAGSVQVADSYVTTPNTSCSRVAIDLYLRDGTYLGSAYYTHNYTLWYGVYNPVNASQSWTPTTFLIAYTYDYQQEIRDFPYCTTFGNHLHQGASWQFSRRVSSTATGTYPNADQHPGYNVYYHPVTSNGWWQNQRTW